MVLEGWLGVVGEEVVAGELRTIVVGDVVGEAVGHLCRHKSVGGMRMI